MQHCKFLICLTSLVSNYSLVTDYVAYRHSVKPLSGIIIFETKSFSGDGIEREQQQGLQIPQVFVKNKAIPNLHELMGVSSIALVFMEKLDKPRTWALVSESLRKLTFIPMVFISQAVPRWNAQFKFFSYFRQLNMLNTVVLFREHDTMMVRTSIAYPKMQIIAVDPGNFSGFVWPKFRNVFGYQFHLSVFEDAPLVYTHMTKNRTELRGLVGQLLLVFMKRINGTFTVISYPMNDSMKQIIDMTGNLVIRTDLIHHTMEPSYPVLQAKTCLILPVESGIPLSWYLLYAFDIRTWQLQGFTFPIIVLLVIGIHRNYNHSRDLVLHVLFVLKLFLAQPASLPGIRSVITGVFLFYFGVLFIVVVSAYEGSLTSLFSARVRMPAVRTPEDLLKIDLKIMVTDIEREIYFDTKLLPPSLEPCLYDAGSGTSAIDLMNGNISFAYVMRSDKWLWYEKRQQHLETPVFRTTTGNFCTPNMLHSFALQKQSPFNGILKIIFMELQQFGFIEHWLAQVPPASKFQLSNQTGMVEVPLSLAHFTLGFHILAAGWFLALITFVGESIIWRRRRSSLRDFFCG